MAIVLYLSGYLSDYLIEKKKKECTIIRKCFCCFGKYINHKCNKIIKNFLQDL